MKAKNMKYRELINKSKEIGKIINKSFITILLDVIKCSKKYGSNFKEYFELEFYLLNDNERGTYVTSRYNEEIIEKYNDKDISCKLNNKCELYKEFKDYLGREFINLNEVSFKEFKDFIKDKEKIVAKRLDSNEGSIEVIELDKTKLKNEYNILKIYNSIMKNEQFLVEEYINQHKQLESLFSKSVNSLNVITFVSSNGEVCVLNSTLRVGSNDSVDNFSSEGLWLFVNDKGVIINESLKNFKEQHPTNKVLEGFVVPKYDEAIKLVKELALVLPSIKYVSWNIAITDEHVLLIGANCFPKVNQRISSLGSKTGDLVKYKKYMDI